MTLSKREKGGEGGEREMEGERQRERGGGREGDRERGRGGREGV